MGVAPHEEEPQDEGENWCSTHEQYYRVGLACGGCMEDSMDRMLQDRLDEKGKP